MAKNHYVSQFVIKRFSDAINIFDIHSGKIDESKRPHKVFYHNDIYEEQSFDLSVLSNKAVGSHRTLRRRYRQVSSLRSIRACGRRRNGENAIERRSEQSAGNAASGNRALNVCTKNHTGLPTVARTTGKPI